MKTVAVKTWNLGLIQLLLETITKLRDLVGTRIKRLVTPSPDPAWPLRIAFHQQKSRPLAPILRDSPLQFRPTRSLETHAYHSIEGIQNGMDAFLFAPPAIPVPPSSLIHWSAPLGSTTHEHLGLSWLFNFKRAVVISLY